MVEDKIGTCDHLLGWFPISYLNEMVVLMFSLVIRLCLIKFLPSMTSNDGSFLDQNFLFTSKEENSELKAIDFGLSDFVKPGILESFYA